MLPDTTFLVVIFIIATVFGIGFALTCARMAESKGKNRKVWGVAGFLFGAIAVAILAVTPSQKTANDEGSDPVNLLRNLEESRDKGEITEEEFQEQKNLLISGK
jgi:hypothetical protein